MGLLSNCLELCVHQPSYIYTFTKDKIDNIDETFQQIVFYEHFFLLKLNFFRESKLKHFLSDVVKEKTIQFILSISITIYDIKTSKRKQKYIK